MNVVLNGRNKEKLLNAVDKIGQPERTALVVGDITHADSAEQIVRDSVEQFGRIDVLVNKAGIFYAKSLKLGGWQILLGSRRTGLTD